MAASMIPKPGTMHGPCMEPCTHRDCAMSRKDADKVCRHCGKTIGYETLYFADGNPDGDKYSELVHYICEMEMIEREM